MASNSTCRCFFFSTEEPLSLKDFTMRESQAQSIIGGPKRQVPHMLEHIGLAQPMRVTSGFLCPGV